MKEIGNIFKEKREEIGITVEEVSKDLEVEPILIENLEEGNDKVFKDVLEVKKIIELYSKYLDIENLKLLEEYNDYLFEKTSRINQEDIRKELNRIEKKEKAIKSPYTNIEFSQSSDKTGVFLIIVLLLILVLMYFILQRLIIG